MFWFAFGRLFEKNIVTTACRGVDALRVLDYGRGWTNDKLSSILSDGHLEFIKFISRSVFYFDWNLIRGYKAAFSKMTLLLFIFCFQFKVLLQLTGHLISQWLQFRHVRLHLADDTIFWIYSCDCFWSQVVWLVFMTLAHKVAWGHVSDALRWVLEIYFAVKLAEKLGILLYANMVFTN